jgi:RNA polymerase sigma-70 factor (ECF subfamily)
MTEPGAFHDLIRRIRAGDQDAAAELVRQYEPTIRRAVRFRLVDARLGALFDSMDICQSVLASFFVRSAAGAFELDRPEQVLKLLVTMARNKLASQARQQHAARRDQRRAQAASPEQHEFVAPDPSPSQQVSAQELFREVQQRLAPEEQRLIELRNEGLEWAEIAAQLGGNAVALRKQLSRALDRVTRELGLEEPTHE